MKNKKTLLILKRNLSLIILVGILGILFIGTLVVTWLSRRQQELRQRASVDQGLVVVTATPSSQLTVGQPASIDFSINTNSVQVDGVQIFFTVNSQIGSSFDFLMESGSGLNLVAKIIEDQGSGQYLVKIIAIGIVGQPFSTSNTVTFGHLTFTPTTAGALSLAFDNTNSRATVYQSSPVEDQLRTIANLNLQAIVAATATPSPTPTAGTGGTTIKQCNESCSSNSQCATNYTCYDSHCRLATNPTNTSCQSAPDQGIHRACNEYCADNRECGTGLTCYFNKCRNPNNVSSESCQASTSTTSTSTGGTTKSSSTASNSKPTSIPKYATPTPNYITQATPDTITNVFGSTPQPTSALPTFTPIATPVLTPVPVPLNQDEDGSTLNRLPQILLIAALISLPILFFGPALISKMATRHPSGTNPSGLEHSVASRPSTPLPKSGSETGSSMKGFAGITSPSSEDMKDNPDKSQVKKTLP